MLDDGRIFHVNINCTDLERSRAFYVDGCGLVDGARTSPEEPQAGEAFGFERAWWDAHILIGAGGFDGGAVDLLQWLEPEPTGAPPAALTQAGFQRIGLEVPDVEVVRRRCAATGGTVDGEVVRDPDGTAVDLRQGGSTRLTFVAVASADLDRSATFYRALGFGEVARGTAAVGGGSMPEIVLAGPGGGEVQLRLVGVHPASVEVAEARPANALGLWRTALLLPELDRAVGRLRAAGIALLSEVQAMSMGPGLPDLRFVCFRGPDEEVIELIEVPEPVAHT